MTKKNLVLHHGKCIDGFTSAWVASLALDPDDTEFVPCVYGPERVSPDVSGRDVWVLDFSFPRDQMLFMSEEASSLTVLDHHVTAQKDLEGLPFCVFDMERSGAGMTWDWFMEGDARPWLVDYVEDRDLWRWALPCSKEVNAAIGSYEQSFTSWDELRARSLEDVAAEGRVLLRSVDKYVSSMVDQARRMTFAGYSDIPVVNAPYLNISELVGKLAEEATFAVGWSQNSDGTFVYSLRSRDGSFDVSQVARGFGGGGHRAAAGFVSTCLPDELSGPY